MTSYHLSVGYNRTKVEQPFERLVDAFKAVVADPDGLLAEIARVECPPDVECYRECAACFLSEDMFTYRISEPGDTSFRGQIVLLSPSPGGMEARAVVRRAILRLVLAAMHRQGIEINVGVA